MALGEAGLDTLASTPFILQEKVFRQQIALSEALCKPLVIHCVKAWQQLITFKKETTPRMPWVIHGFRGNKQLAEQLIRQDCWLSFGEKFNPEAVRAAYPNRILAETDESLLSIQKIYQQLADTSGIDAHLFSNTLRENVRTVFTI
ncbi:TatD DNase family protein [Macellibacteroides fermentans]|uniref:TatD DNase family protein n=1 Tax=Macellibacteroides fermentans TaxID=879969 RepID=A0A8E1ZZC0_9PORP|nr:TatD DNase family protein [Macellibacteroides fermentans]